MQRQKRIALINDITGFGRCSIAAMAPIVSAMKIQSVVVPTAILSRQTAGILGSSLIINLPGQPKAIKECLEPIFAAIPYCLDLIGAAYIETDENYIKAFRPNKK